MPSGASVPILTTGVLPTVPRMFAKIVIVEWRSEEHTSELQSHSDIVCRRLLEKKNRPKVHESRDQKAKRSETPGWRQADRQLYPGVEGGSPGRLPVFGSPRHPILRPRGGHA